MTPDEKHAYARQFPVHVGVDTAKQFHVLVALGPDGRRTKPFKVLVSRAGFEAADAHLRSLFPDLAPTPLLVGLEFAGHHGFTFARFLADRGYPVVNVLPTHTNRSKELEDNSPLKTDAKDAGRPDPAGLRHPADRPGCGGEKVLALQQAKRDLAEAIISEDNSVIAGIAREDLEFLLS